MKFEASEKMAAKVRDKVADIEGIWITELDEVHKKEEDEDEEL